MSTLDRITQNFEAYSIAARRLADGLTQIAADPECPPQLRLIVLRTLEDARAVLQEQSA